jgi:hypothetical protein
MVSTKNLDVQAGELIVVESLIIHESTEFKINDEKIINSNET